VKMTILSRQFSPIKLQAILAVTLGYAFCCNSAIAYEYSVRRAFCLDYSRSKSSVYSSTFQYDRQVAYNSCMKNASDRIRKYEAEKEHQRKVRLEQQKQWQIESEKKRKRELQQKLIEKRKLEAYNKRIDSLVDNAQNLFR